MALITVQDQVLFVPSSLFCDSHKFCTYCKTSGHSEYLHPDFRNVLGSIISCPHKLFLYYSENHNKWREINNYLKIGLPSSVVSDLLAKIHNHRASIFQHKRSSQRSIPSIPSRTLTIDIPVQIDTRHLCPWCHVL